MVNFRQWPPQSNATGIFVPKDNWNITPTEIVSCHSKCFLENILYYYSVI